MGSTSHRPDVLAYPSPATARYLVLVGALLSSGLFVGNWFYTQVHGDEWARVLLSCTGLGPGDATAAELLADQAAASACQADVERTRSLYAIGGAVVALVVAVSLVYLAPIVVRRRRRLRPLGPALGGTSERFAALASEAGVTARVTPLIGPSTLRDAFSFGAPGRYAVALPPALAVRWRDTGLFDPLVRHELAHARHRDIALAWLTRSVWYAVVPLLLAPVAQAVVSGDFSILPSYLWRAALLAGSFALLSAALLRAREHAADLRASRWQGDVDVMARVVGAARAVPGTGWRGLVARHPTPGERVDVLRGPHRVARLHLWDGLTGAFLAGFAGPLIVSALSPGLAASGRSMQSYVVAAVVLGPLVGSSVGLAVWRAAFVARLRGETADVLRVAAGAGLGLSVGLGVSLATAGLPGLSGIGDPRGLVLPGIACAGATVLSSGLAHLLADLAPRFGGAGSARVVTLAVNSLLFSAVFWAGYVLQAMVEIGGWATGRIVLMDLLTTWQVLAVELGLAAVAATALALRSPARTRAWQLEGADAEPWVAVPRPGLAATVGLGVAGGVAATLVIVTWRLVTGPSPTDAATWDRFEGFQWAIAVSAAVVGAVLMVRDPHRGGGSAMLAVPVAAVTGVVGYLALNTALGGDLATSFVWLVLRPSLVLACYVMWAFAPVAYAIGRWLDVPQAGRRGAAVAVTATLVLGAAGAVAAVAGRSYLVGYNPFASPDVVAGDLADESGDALATYRTAVMLPLSQAYQALSERAVAIDQDASLDAATRSARMEDEVVGPVQGLREQWGDAGTDDTAVVAAHAVALQALDAAARKYHAAAIGYLADDEATADAARAEVVRLGGEENAAWERWVAAVAGATP